MIIEFKSNKMSLIDKKLKRFNDLKVKNFSGILTDTEEIELDETAEWLKIHNQ